MTTLRIQDILGKLRGIQAKIENLKIPPASYLGINKNSNSFHVVGCGDTKLITHNYNEEKGLSLFLKNQAEKQNTKFIAAGLAFDNAEELASRLWLKEDIVPYLNEKFVNLKDKSARNIAQKIQGFFDENNLIKIKLLKNNEAEVAFLTNLDEYQNTCSKNDFENLLTIAKRLKDKRIIFIGATAQGGGVSLMRHALIRLFKLLKVNASWHILKERTQAFDITKRKFHNVLQGVSDIGIDFTKQDKKIYSSWIKENAEILKTPIKEADIIVIDDLQPNGLVPIIKKMNTKAKIIYRSHVQLESHLIKEKGTVQNKVWDFIWNNIKTCDCFVAHPIKNFIPSSVPVKKVVMMPAVTDPLDGLNKKLTEKQIDYYLKIFNRFLLQSNQRTLDLKRPYIIQVARFDPSKGIPDVLDSYMKLRKMLKKHNKEIPQLVIIGNGSVDDPDGIPIFNMTMQILGQIEFKEAAKDIKVIRLRHLDQLLNALERKCKIALQLSYKEGFEIKITECLMKGKPVIAYKAGGIPLQIIDGVTGYLTEKGDTDRVAELMFELLTDEEKYEKISDQASQQFRKDVLTVPNALRWFNLFNELSKKGNVKGFMKHVN
ncbi:MAG: glycosyltransferase [Candidatus Levyibacteriota bacterium]